MNATDLETRCTSTCPFDTPHAMQARMASAYLGIHGYRERCTLPEGHGGDHLGPSDVRWEEVDVPHADPRFIDCPGSGCERRVRRPGPGETVHCECGQVVVGAHSCESLPPPGNTLTLTVADEFDAPPSEPRFRPGQYVRWNQGDGIIRRSLSGPGGTWYAVGDESTWVEEALLREADTPVVITYYLSRAFTMPTDGVRVAFDAEGGFRTLP